MRSLVGIIELGVEGGDIIILLFQILPLKYIPTPPSEILLKLIKTTHTYIYIICVCVCVFHRRNCGT